MAKTAILESTTPVAEASASVIQSISTETPPHFRKEDDMSNYNTRAHSGEVGSTRSGTALNELPRHVKITALYERLSNADERHRIRGEDSDSIQNQKKQLEDYAKAHGFSNIKHYTDDDESGRFFDRGGYQEMIEDIEQGKVGVVIMKDMTRWGRSHVQVGQAMEFFRIHKVRFIAVNNSIDSDNPESLEFAPFINIMSEWYAKDCSKKIRLDYSPLSRSRPKS